MTKNTEEYFWSKTKKVGDCLEWQMARDKKGYGTTSYLGKNWKSHRLAWFFYNKKDIPDGMLICHKCDNPPCCNPEHLFLGTPLDNIRDAKRKGRMASGDRSGANTHPERRAFGDRNGMRTCPKTACKGQENGRAKLSEIDVLSIRHRINSGINSISDISEEYNVDYTTIMRIVNKKTWKHI